MTILIGFSAAAALSTATTDCENSGEKLNFFFLMGDAGVPDLIVDPGEKDTLIQITLEIKRLYSIENQVKNYTKGKEISRKGYFHEALIKLNTPSQHSKLDKSHQNRYLYTI